MYEMYVDIGYLVIIHLVIGIQDFFAGPPKRLLTSFVLN